MATVLEDKNRKYKRIRPSVEEKQKLAENNLQWVLSSNVSAIANINENLIVRFHNGSLYEYKNVGHWLDDMLRSSSKGKFVHRKLIKGNIPYKKIGSLPLTSDIPLNDTEIFKNIETQGITVEEPQILGTQDIITSFKQIAVFSILDNISGINILPFDIIPEK